MKEISEIISAYERAVQEGKKTALVTLVHVDGSSYRRPGARMLVTEDGELTGAISGGCLEGDALNKALLAIHQQKNNLVTYDTSDEEDAVLGLGLGCNGIIQVLIQPAEQPLQLLKKITASRKHHVLVTLFSLTDKRGPQPGTLMYKDEHETVYCGNIDDEIKHVLQTDVDEAYTSRESSFKTYRSAQHDVTAYIEHISPVVSLVIAGAGNDAEPVNAIASVLGWQVTLIDDGRDKNTKGNRFAGACHLVVPDPENALKDIEADEYTFFLLMTHNYNYDIAMLRQLLKKNARYIGVLGPRKKLDRMLDELAHEGMHLSEHQMHSIYSPVGLDIGAETPEEIALSMIAEIKTVLASRNAASLRNNKDVIHPRSKTIIETKHLL
jgi:xanthine/CO dehydrogenase XdhC/CoxF family maturation factor